MVVFVVHCDSPTYYACKTVMKYSAMRGMCAMCMCERQLNWELHIKIRLDFTTI